MNIAILPARGGSKRIPRKNIKEFCGKPMIAWSIEAAKKSGIFDKIVVSTDDAEIASIARSYGADIPFKRPVEFSDDKTGTHAVIKHAIQALEAQTISCQHICCIYPTAPFIQVQDILEGYENITQTPQVQYSFPVCEFSYPIQRALKYNEGKLSMFQPHHFTSRSQDLEPAYHDAGQFYWGTKEAYLNDLPIFSDRTLPIIIPRMRTIDIDTVEDWELALLMAQYLLPRG